VVPQSTRVLLQAWNTWVHYATFHLPPEFNGYYGYNAVQQIAYFSVVFVFGPLAILSGIAMSSGFHPYCSRCRAGSRISTATVIRTQGRIQTRKRRSGG